MFVGVGPARVSSNYCIIVYVYMYGWLYRSETCSHRPVPILRVSYLSMRLMQSVGKEERQEVWEGDTMRERIHLINY